jgi:hypothetical protein
MPCLAATMVSKKLVANKNSWFQNLAAQKKRNDTLASTWACYQAVPLFCTGGKKAELGIAAPSAPKSGN